MIFLYYILILFDEFREIMIKNERNIFVGDNRKKRRGD